MSFLVGKLRNDRIFLNCHLATPDKNNVYRQVQGKADGGLSVGWASLTAIGSGQRKCATSREGDSQTCKTKPALECDQTSRFENWATGNTGIEEQVRCHHEEKRKIN